jgi:hypothetical protein
MQSKPDSPVGAILRCLHGFTTILPGCLLGEPMDVVPDATLAAGVREGTVHGWTAIVIDAASGRQNIVKDGVMKFRSDLGHPQNLDSRFPVSLIGIL